MLYILIFITSPNEPQHWLRNHPTFPPACSNLVKRTWERQVHQGSPVCYHAEVNFTRLISSLQIHKIFDLYKCH